MKYSVLMSIYAKTTVDELTSSVDSMIWQTIKPDEFIIVCDGPISKEVKGLLQEYEQKYKGLFNIVELKQNCGLACALNAGIKEAKNELIARMDSDDISLETRCEKQLKAFASDENLTLVGTRTLDYSDNIEEAVEKIDIYPTDYESIKKMIKRNDPFAHPTVMYKKSAVVACGLYDPELRRRQDYDLFSKMVNRGYKAINLPEALLYYKMDKDNVKRVKSKESCKSRILVQRRIYERGECSIFDYLYIVFAMSVSRVLPESIFNIIYKIIKR